MVMSASSTEGRTWKSALLTVPKKYNAMVRVRIPRETKRGIARLAKRRKLYPSDLYRQAIEDYLQEQKGIDGLTDAGVDISLGDRTKSA